MSNAMLIFPVILQCSYDVNCTRLTGLNMIWRQKDQDYRSASVKDKVSHTISITGIPKTATMEQVGNIIYYLAMRQVTCVLLLDSIVVLILNLSQILGAFAVRDGVPMQGMKIKNVVPGKIQVPVWLISRANDSPTVLRFVSPFRCSNRYAYTVSLFTPTLSILTKPLTSSTCLRSFSV